MAIAKLKWAAGLLAVGGTLALGTWGLGQGPGGRPSSQPDPSPPAARDEKPAAGERTADYAQRQRSLMNLKAIARAIINYHDTYNRFPADITDKAGKPLLSWRVELLPYLEQPDMYKQFKRDEPWDSEHNWKLLAQMPEVFRVGFEPKGATHTYYQRFAIAGLPGVGPAMGEGGGGIPGVAGTTAPAAGPAPPPGGPPGMPGTGAPPAGGPRLPSSFAEVTDGLSNTLGVIEAGPSVPWTKPADFVYDRAQSLPKLTGPFANVRHIALLDGQTHALKPNLDETTLRRLIDPNDGQVTPDLKPLRARFPADTEADKKALAKLVEDNQALIDAIEKLGTENAELLRRYARATRDADRAEETQEWLRRTLDNLKAVNKKYRDEFGLPANAPLPNDASKGP